MIYPQVKPSGWLKDYLRTQMSGLTGHIDKAGFPYDRGFWGEKEIPPFNSWSWWWPFEQTGYYIDGYTRAAILLRSPARIAKAKRILYSVLEHPDQDGYLGPKELKETTDPDNRWPHVVFFRACLAMYAYTADQRIVDALTRHYLGCPVDHSAVRNVINVEIMLALYEINGNKDLLAMAKENYDKSMEQDLLQIQKDAYTPANVHGVTYNEYAKLGALLYRSTQQERYLLHSIRAYQKIQRLYMLPGGCNSSSEYLYSDRYDEVYETCDIADMTWSLHYLAQICEDPQYSDMIERCVFNAGIGSVTEDFCALQYFSCANQLMLNESSSHCRFHIGNGAMRYAPNPFTQCCAGNVNRIMPNYVMSMWSCNQDTVTARMFGPSEYSGRIGEKPFSIREITDYPFDLSVTFEIQTKTSFVLRIRIPGWCENAALTGADYEKEKGFFVVKITADAQLKLTFDGKIEQCENHDGVYFVRGPLVYSLGMKGHRQTCGKRDFPAYRMEPNRPWNYAVIGDGEPVFEQGSDRVWDVEKDIPRIMVSAKTVENWKICTVDKISGVDNDYNPVEKTGKFALTPTLPDKGAMRLSSGEERITLYPYGACKVRMTVLPQIL